MVSTDPDGTQEIRCSPRRSVSESELARANEETSTNDVDDTTNNGWFGECNDRHRPLSRNDFRGTITLPRFMSTKKKRKFKYVNIDSQPSKSHEETSNNGKPLLEKKKSFVSKFVGRMRRHISLFSISSSANDDSCQLNQPKKHSAVIKDEIDKSVKPSRRDLYHHHRKEQRRTLRKSMSASSNDVRHSPVTNVDDSSRTNHSSGNIHNVKSDSVINNSTSVSVTPGLAGITNHGNTCFMNAVLQCLSHTDILAEYFVTNQYKADLHRSYKLLHSRRNGGTRGELTEHLALLLKSLWLCQYTPEVSTNFKNIVCKYGSQYRGSNQHDAQEFLLWLLDKVHEDLNTATKTRYKKPKNSNGRPDEVVAAETLANHMRCNNSFVQDLFQAQFRSSLRCPTCHKQSNTFDPFRCVSIPIPQRNTRPVFVIVVFMSSSALHPPKQVKLGVSVNVNANVKELRDALSSKTGISDSQIVLTKLSCDGFYHDFNDNQPISDVNDDGSIYAIETTVTDNDDSAEQLILLWHNRIGIDGPKFGYCYVARVPREATYDEIQTAMIDRMANELKDDAVNKMKLKIRVLDDVGCHLATDVDHPLYMPAVDKALLMFEIDGSGPKHLKLTVEWDKEQAHSIVDVSDGQVDIDDSLDELLREQHKPNIVTLDDCFQLYTQEEQLGPENAWFCPACRHLQQGVKKLSLWSLPDILVIHLKRFRQTSAEHTKLDTLVKIPVSGLDMSPNSAFRNHNNNYHQHNGYHQHHSQLAYWSPWKRHRHLPYKHSDNVYDLYAICNHHGNIQGGHYTAACKNPTNGKWFVFDDTKLDPIVEENQIITKSAYLLFYQRRNLVSLSGSSNSSSASSCSSSSTSNVSGDHWVFRIPATNYTPPKVTKSQDNLLDIDEVSKKDDTGHAFNRGVRAYATMSPKSSKQNGSVDIMSETENCSDDERVISPSPRKWIGTDEKPTKVPSAGDKSKTKSKPVEECGNEEMTNDVITYTFVESCV